MDDSTCTPIIIGSDEEDDDIVVIKEELVPIDIDDDDDVVVVEEKCSLPIKKESTKVSLPAASEEGSEPKSEENVALDLRVKVISLSEADSTSEEDSSEDSKSFPIPSSSEQNSVSFQIPSSSEQNSVSLFDTIFPDTTDQLTKAANVNSDNLSNSVDFTKTRTKADDIASSDTLCNIASNLLPNSSVSSSIAPFPDKNSDTAAGVCQLSSHLDKSVLLTPPGGSSSAFINSNNLSQGPQVIPVSSCGAPAVFQSTYSQCPNLSGISVQSSFRAAPPSVCTNKTLNSHVIPHCSSAAVTNWECLQSSCPSNSKTDEFDSANFAKTSKCLSHSLSGISAESLPPRKRLKHDFKSQVSCPALVSTNSSAYSNQPTCVSCCACLSGVNVSRCIQGHPTCGTCLEEAVRLVLTGKGKSAVKCLAKTCDVYYPASELRHTLPKMVVDILEDKLDQDYVNYISDMMLPSTSTTDEANTDTKDRSDDNKSSPKLTKTEAEILADLAECIESGENKPEKSEYPSLWTKMDPKLTYVFVPLEPESIEYLEIALRFYETMKFPIADIVKVSRVQNPILWKYFAVKRTEMIHDNDGIDVEEKYLFHGTQANVVDAICRKGFDWRVCGKHGTMYGQGSYFAVDASYSHQYSDKSRGTSSRSAFYPTSSKPILSPFRLQRPPPGNTSQSSNNLYTMLVNPYYANNVPAHSNSGVQSQSTPNNNSLPGSNYGLIVYQPTQSASSKANTVLNIPPVQSAQSNLQLSANQTSSVLASNSQTLSSDISSSSMSVSSPSAMGVNLLQPTSSSKLNPGQPSLILPGSSCIMSTSYASSASLPLPIPPNQSNDKILQQYSGYKVQKLLQDANQPKTVVHPPSNGNTPSPLVNALFGMNTPNYVQPIDPQACAPPDPEKDQVTLQMFFVHALVGKYTGGKKNLRKPPPLYPVIDPYGKCYDSCVDEVFNPKIFVVFDTAQVYPEYLIEYKYTPS